jgi:two-component sensor histidine kinase
MHVDRLFQNTSDRPDSLILVAEISHRVVNEYTHAIACIRLAAAGIASTEARNVLVETATKLRCFADAHRALQPPHSAREVDLGEYLARLCSASMAAGLQERGVRLNLLCEPVHLSSARCWRVGLIVSELVTNGVRHGLRGGPGEVTIELETDGDAVICRICDDGEASPVIQPARGLSVVKGLAADLQGEVCWRFDALGTTAELSFPRGTSERGA